MVCGSARAVPPPNVSYEVDRDGNIPDVYCPAVIVGEPVLGMLQCPQCTPYKARTRSNLSYHLQHAHGVVPLPRVSLRLPPQLLHCSHCAFTTKKKSSLKVRELLCQWPQL